MATLPDDRLGQLQFCETHVPQWEIDPTAIGLNTLQVTQLQNATATAREKFNTALSARQASKNATTASNDAIAEMRTIAAKLIKQIRAFAELQAKPNTVLELAGIDPVAPPTPAAAPGKPTDFNVKLEPTGAVTISWTASDAAASTGAFFTIARKLPGQGFFASIGGAPGGTTEQRRPSFTDETVPSSAAASGVQYVVQGRRGTRIGEMSDVLTVQFGVGGAGVSFTTQAFNGEKVAA